MTGRRLLPVVLLSAFALCASAPGAGAAIPQGNTLLNPGGETGAAATDEISHFCPQGWTCEGTPPNTTLVRYGTTTFPTAAEGARIGGGNNFFAGGPDNSISGVQQTVTIGEQPEFSAGAVKATLGGCLGGFLAQNDRANILLDFLTRDDPDGNSPSNEFVRNGPTAGERGNATTLLPLSRTVTVPPDTTGFRFTLSFVREGPGYNDGYADNLSVTFGPAAGPDPPGPTCSAPSGPGPAPGPGPGDPGGDSKAVKLLSFGKAVVGKDGKVRVRVRCNSRQVNRCKGTLSASLARGAKAKAKRSLGRARYSIPSLKARKVTIAPRRAVVQAMRGLSKRALARARIKLRATTKVSGVKFTQRSSLRVRRPT